MGRPQRHFRIVASGKKDHNYGFDAISESLEKQLENVIAVWIDNETALRNAVIALIHNIGFVCSLFKNCTKTTI